MKKVCTLLLAAGIFFSASTGASAIDFKAKGQWLMGFGLFDNQLVHKTRNGTEETKNTRDKFGAQQRVRLQLDAVASESLSGTVYFEIGNTHWGQNSSGGALGADGRIIELKRAYIDWLVPETPLKVRMGIQGVLMPNAAGGTAIMDTDVAGVTANYAINDNVSVTALWARPLNDNFDGERYTGAKDSSGNEIFRNTGKSGYLDNLDLFSLMVPMKFDGFEITPWAMYGMKGANSMEHIEDFNGKSTQEFSTMDGNLNFSLYPYPKIVGRDYIGGSSKGYGSMFWAGLPFSITAFDPFNIEVDINYGYVEEMGRYSTRRFEGELKRASTKREGWLAKALVEYKMDWGVPGILGWYASGDDNNPRNGSERMPTMVPMGNFTSYLGDGNMGWGWQDYALEYSGTWGVGIQLRDMSFVEDLDHTFRAVYWGGTNSPGMVKYMDTAYAWNAGWGSNTSPYLTTNDGLLEFNLVNNYKMYENFDVNLDLAYVANFMDNDTWKKSGNRNTSFQKQDAWRAQLVFAYSF